MAPSVATGTTGLERLLLIFLMKNQPIRLQRAKPSPANDRLSNQSVKNLQTPKNLQKRDCNSTPIDSDVETFTETCNRTKNLPLLQQNSRFTKQKRERTVKLRVNRLKTAQTTRNLKKSIESLNERWQTSDYRLEPKRTAEDSNSPNKTRTNSGKLDFTEQNFKRTVENSTSPNKTRTNGGNSTSPNKTRMNGGKWLHQHTTTQKLQKLQELTLWMGT